MTDWARHQQSAQMTTQNLQATLQDLLYNNYEPLPTYRLVTLQLVAPTKGDEADLGHTRKNA